MSNVKILVTLEKFDEFFSIEEWFSFSNMNNIEMYEKMILFVVDENDQPVTPETARQLFKQVKRKEWQNYIVQFMKAINDAFVSPTNGGG